jgi:tetrahydromethanopterin S-methyltransferase subunit H
MFVFKKEQRAFDFGGVTIGGQPGENPTALVGGLFFKGQTIVEDTRKGTFDKTTTKQWIESGLQMVEKTGHPLVIQAYGRTPAAIENHLSWLADNYEGPFMFESINADARVSAIRYCQDSGLTDRAIYNSVNLSMKEGEKETLRQSSINMAVVLGWTPRATTLGDRMETIKKSLSLAESIGISKVLVDPATMPVGAGYGLEYRTTIAIKSELCVPTCLGPHNAPSAWAFLKQPGFDDASTMIAALIASTVAAQLFATDSIMYGSMANTKEVFTAVALTGNAMATAIAEANNALGIDRSLFDPPTYE